MTYTTLVSTDVLAANLASGWAIVDCRYDLKDDAWGEAEYRRGHVPGAVYASLHDDLSDHAAGHGGRHPLPSVDALAATFERLGIGTGTQVVAYDQDAGPWASRLWWSLKYLGHDAVAVLDGGWAKWAREGRLSASGVETRARAAFTPAPRPGMQVGLGDVAAISERGGKLLVDARAPERFEGREESVDKRAGHIPGAANRFYKTNLGPEGTMLPPDELRRQFAALLDGRPPQDAVMYCGSGVTACHNLLAMAHAGLSGTPLYVGSWSEWSSDPARPAETGPPR